MKQFNLLGDSEEAYFCYSCLLTTMLFQNMSDYDFMDLYQVTPKQTSRDIQYAFNLPKANTPEHKKSKKVYLRKTLFL